jgi:hypothetical protein
MPSKFAELMASIFLPVFSELGKTELKKVLAQLHKDDPTGYATVLTTLYPVIDVYLETLVKKSGTKFDDPIVMALMNAVEESAAEFGLTLPNLDTD